MRLPIVTRRRAEAAVDLAVRAVWHLVDNAEKATCEARLDQRRTEAELAVERKQRQRAIAYVGQAERRRNTDGHRLARALRAVAAERAQSAAYRRTIDRLTDQLLDATGYQAEPLLPEARTVLGITKEDA
ncbi:hypothetical protein AB0B30_32690 [Streptomyces narbonensis]|uniref:Uncharacterized protein n=1 Tax=Streptomyces narbonensis TaxID=67333 RepID=A0ABV3CIU3_9ACTN